MGFSGAAQALVPRAGQQLRGTAELDPKRTVQVRRRVSLS